mgnify:CR=1 FL=1
MDEKRTDSHKKKAEEFPKMIRMNEGRAQNLEFLRNEWTPIENPKYLLLKPDNKTEQKNTKKQNRK